LDPKLRDLGASEFVLFALGVFGEDQGVESNRVVDRASDPSATAGCSLFDLGDLQVEVCYVDLVVGHLCFSVLERVVLRLALTHMSHAVCNTASRIRIHFQKCFHVSQTCEKAHPFLGELRGTCTCLVVAGDIPSSLGSVPDLLAFDDVENRIVGRIVVIIPIFVVLIEVVDYAKYAKTLRILHLAMNCIRISQTGIQLWTLMIS
jgi:hypothetical protein